MPMAVRLLLLLSLSCQFSTSTAHDYTIVVYTGNKFGAGTNAKVFIRLYGFRDTSREIRLHDEENGDEFERRKSDIFTIQTRALGELHKIYIRSDTSGQFSGWFLEKVVITDTDDDRDKHREYPFYIHQWLVKHKAGVMVYSGVPSGIRNLTAISKCNEIILSWKKPMYLGQSSSDNTIYIIKCNDTSITYETQQSNWTFTASGKRSVILCQVSAKTDIGLGPVNMIIIYVKSCGPKASCTDENKKNCPQWKSNGYCLSSSEYHNFMKINCKKTCGLCPNLATASCTDDNMEKCQIWKSNGFCVSSSEWYNYMKENCKKTCGLCSKQGRSVPSKVRNLTMVQVGCEIVLSWQKPTYTASTTDVTYVIRCNETSFIDETQRSNWTFSVPIKGSVIHCQVSAKTSAGLGLTSMVAIDPIPCRPKVPSEVQNLTGMSHCDQINLSWDKPMMDSEQSSINVAYIIRCNETDFINETQKTNLIFAVFVEVSVIHCQVCAKTSAGLGPFSMIAIDRNSCEPRNPETTDKTELVVYWSFGTLAVACTLLLIIMKIRKQGMIFVADEEFENIPLNLHVGEGQRKPQENVEADNNLYSGKIISGASRFREEGSASPIYESHDGNKLKYLEVLSRGTFSKVLKAQAENIEEWTNVSIVAVKVFENDADQQGMKHFHNEVEILKTIGLHPHIIRLIRCCSHEGHKCIIFDYFSNGCLISFLRNSHAGVPEAPKQDIHKGNLNQKTLLSFALDIAKGMKFLSSKNIIHRDLACRNVLVDSQLNCKICDFGLARKLGEPRSLKRLQGENLPVKWLSPESVLKGTFTIESDIWSFGITLYEIVTIGGSPYPGHKSEDIESLLEHEYRMARPVYCGKEIYNIMLKCWKEKPFERPSFEILVEQLESLLQIEKNTYINLDAYQDRHCINLEEDENIR